MTIDELNQLSEPQAEEALLKCCGAANWAKKVLEKRPFVSKAGLFDLAEKVWYNGTQEDWLEAFSAHPRIGDLKSLEKKFDTTKDWAGNEQAGVNSANHETLKELAEGNRAYEKKFGFIFIVCATGKGADEMLANLKERLPNDREKELKIAMGEQNKITRLRLEKLMDE